MTAISTSAQRLDTKAELRVGVGDFQIVLDVYGATGPNVVLLHGIPGDRRAWSDVAHALASQHRVYAPDLAGFGDSSSAPHGFHASGQADIIVKLVAELGLEELHLVGFDFGGPIAVLAAAKLASRVQTLTIANTNVLPDTPVPLPLRIARVPGLGALAYRMFFGRTGLRGMWLAASRDKVAFPLRRFERVLDRAQTIASTRDVFLTSMRDLPGLYGPVRSALASLRLPVQVIWSDRDPFFPVGVGERTLAQCHNGRLAILNGVGHFTPYERPTDFATLVSAFIREAGAP